LEKAKNRKISSNILLDFSYFPMNFFFCKLQDIVWTVQKWTCSKAGAIQKKYLNDQDYSYLSVLQDLCVSLELVVLNIYKLWENCTKICSPFHSSCQARYHFASQFKNVDIYIYNFVQTMSCNLQKKKFIGK
jgi:hypothetical protein